VASEICCIFKPRQMARLLSIKTVFPRKGARIWYDDQREAHRQISACDDVADYQFMGADPNSKSPSQHLKVLGRREPTAVVRQGPRHALGRCDLQSQSRRVHRHQDRDGKHRCGLASAPGPQDAKGGLSGVAKVPRAECAVDLPCVAGPGQSLCTGHVDASLKSPAL
jgi:hypothetical protein